MKRQVLITLTSAIVGIGPMMPNTFVLANDIVTIPVQQERTDPITTPEQFVEVFCSMQIVQTDPNTNQVLIDPATQQPVTKPVLIQAADRTNYMILLEGNAFLLTQTPAFIETAKNLYASQLASLQAEKIASVPAANEQPALTPIHTYDELIAQATTIQQQVLQEQEQQRLEEEKRQEEQKRLEEEQQKQLEEQKRLEEEQKKLEQEQQTQPVQQPYPALPTLAPITPTPKPQPAQTIPSISQDQGSPEKETGSENVAAATGPQEETAPIEEASNDAQPTSEAPVVEQEENKEPTLKEMSQEPIEVASAEVIVPEQTAQIEPAMSEPSVAPQPLEPTVAAQPAPQSASISEFIQNYVSDQSGNQYRSATQTNAARILAGMGEWTSLSAAQRAQINAQLRANGGKSYQALVQEAQRLQLMPLAASRRPLVSTSVNTNAGLYALLSSLSLLLMGWLFKKRKSL